MAHTTAGDDARTPEYGGDRDLNGGHRRISRTAVAALIVAVGNVVFGSFLGLFYPVLPAAIAVVAVLLGHLALIRITRTGAAGRGLALTALAVGYLWFAVVAVVVLGLLMFTGFGLAVLGF